MFSDPVWLSGLQHVDVPKLCRQKPLDNLEFLQWIKRYFDINYGGHEYDATSRRGGKAVAMKENDSGNKPAPKTSTAAVKTGAARVATGASRPASAITKKPASEFTMPRLVRVHPFHVSRIPCLPSCPAHHSRFCCVAARKVEFIGACGGTGLVRPASGALAPEPPHATWFAFQFCLKTAPTYTWSTTTS